MRVLFAVAVLALSFPVAACSAGTEDTTLRRAPSAPARSQGSTAGTDDDGDTTSGSTPAPSTSSGPTAPPPAPDGGATTTPPATPAPGSCGAPKCFGIAGFGGCKATDGAGLTVTMGCQEGACTCLSGTLTTTSFAGDVTSSEDARQLFLANCACN